MNIDRQIYWVTNLTGILLGPSQPSTPADIEADVKVVGGSIGPEWVEVMGCFWNCWWWGKYDDCKSAGKDSQTEFPTCKLTYSDWWHHHAQWLTFTAYASYYKLPPFFSKSLLICTLKRVIVACAFRLLSSAFHDCFLLLFLRKFDAQAWVARRLLFNKPVTKSNI